MLPSLSRLNSKALATATPGPKRQRQEDVNVIRDLPPDLQREVLNSITDGPGVPLLLVRKVVYALNREDIRFYAREDNIFYLRLPDPAEGPLDWDRFQGENYGYVEILDGIIRYVGYDGTRTRPGFIKIRPREEQLPAELIWEDDYDEGEDTDVLDFVDDAIKDTARAVDNRKFFGRNTKGEQLLYTNFPTFKSHVAIIMTIEEYD